MDKRQREARRHQEDIALQRGLLWVAGAAILEVLLVLVNRFYINYAIPDGIDIAYGFHYTLRALRIAAPILALAALAWAVVRQWKGGKTALPLIVAIASGAVGICAHVAYKLQEVGISMLFWLVIAWAVLAMVYYIYQREFFLSASGVGMSILGLWFVRFGGGAGLEAALCLGGIILVTIAVLWLKKNEGMLPGKEPTPFLAKDAAYGAVIISCLAGIGALGAAIVLGGTAAYYLIFAMLAWMFALFVYYTVKLM